MLSPASEAQRGVQRAVRLNSLTLVFLLLFAITLVGQLLAGRASYNAAREAHHQPAVSIVQYAQSADFATDVMENWQSEFLQFTFYILLTVWLIQVGSSESRDPSAMGTDDRKERVGPHASADSPRAARAGGRRARVYGHSLVIAMGASFVLSWVAEAIAGRTAFNQEQADHGERMVSLAGYVASADFWDRSLQNWQSEFLAVATMSIFAVFLRSRGSPESKRVGAAHHETTSDD